MGCDGGVIATKRKFMRGYKDADDKEDLKNIKKNQNMRTRICSQSGKVLREPIVACELGNLFNKEDIISALLDRNLNPKFSHIRGLKDIRELNFTPSSTYDASKEVEGDSPCKYICPVTLMEFNGIHPFVAIWPTGFVISEKAVREVGIEGLQAEFGPFTNSDIIPLLPLDEELERQRELMEDRRMKLKSERKLAKKRHLANDTENIIVPGSPIKSTSNATNENFNGQIADEKKSRKKVKTMETTRNNHEIESTGGLSIASTLVKNATNAVSKREDESTVFKGLFHKGNSADKHDRDLFMSIAGLRYTIT